ncbi:unnamed protein product, partial [marine sediment metagenome]
LSTFAAPRLDLGEGLRAKPRAAWGRFMLLIRSIAELAVVPPGPIHGRSMGRLERIQDASLLIDGRAIASFGPQSSVEVPVGCRVIDAGGG